MRKKQKDWEIKSFSLSLKAREAIREGAFLFRIKESEFIDFLSCQWAETLNPEKRSEENLKEINKLKAELEERISRQEEYNSQIGTYNKLKASRKSRKPEAIIILKRKLKEGDMEEVERVAKEWQRITGILALDLINEAQK